MANPVERGDRDGGDRAVVALMIVHSSTVVHRNVHFMSFFRHNPSKNGFIPFLEGRGLCG